MAETEVFRPMEVYWTKDDADITNSSLVYVPGMKDVGNRRPERRPLRVKGRKTAEIKPSVPTSRAPKSDMLAAKKPATVQGILPPGSKKEFKLDKKQASLKDLCPEDKKRVANLVKELARVGEERETVLQVLDKERKLSEKQVDELVSQQESILKEREDIQRQLLSCQQLIAKFQQISQDSNNEGHQYEPERKAEMYTPDKQAHKTPTGASKQGSRSREGQTRTTDADHIRNGHQSRTPTQAQHAQRSRSGERAAESTARHRAANSHPDSDPHNVSTSRKEFWGAGETNVNNEPDGPAGRDPCQKPHNLSDRPFTSKIDMLIEKEKQTRSEFSEPPVHKPAHPGSPPYPLNAPVQSSTLRSEFSTECGPSAAKNDFRPLIPDPSPYSSTYGSEMLNEKAPNANGRVEFKEPPSTQMPNSVGEREFMEKYTQMKPDVKKIELVAQRQALLEEQRNLKAILNQQEQLLLSKKEQLRQQQDIQQQRLQYFEKNGQFPPHSFNEQLGSVSSREDRGPDADSIKMTLPVDTQGSVQGHQPVRQPQAQSAYTNQPWGGHPSAAVPPPLPYPPPGPHQIGPPLPQPPPAGSYPLPLAAPHFLPQPVPVYHPDPRYMNAPPPPAPYAARPEQDLIIESLKNVDLDRMHSPAYQQPGYPPTVENSYPGVFTERRAQQEGAIPSLPQTLNRAWGEDHRAIPTDDHHQIYTHPSSRASPKGLFDLVNDVEGARTNGSPQRHAVHRDTHPETQDRHKRSLDAMRRHDDRSYSSSAQKPHTQSKRHQKQNYPSEATSDDELEESKVLEDIFFLK